MGMGGDPLRKAHCLQSDLAAHSFAGEDPPPYVVLLGANGPRSLEPAVDPGRRDVQRRLVHSICGIDPGCLRPLEPHSDQYVATLCHVLGLCTAARPWGRGADAKKQFVYLKSASNLRPL